MGFNYLFSNRFRYSIFISLVLSIAMLYGVFAIPLVTYNSPTVANYTTVTNNWTYINITSDENLSSSFVEWGNSSGFTNVTMANTSLVNWYNNTTDLVDGVYNYTIWAQNTTGNWSQSDRRFVVIDTVMPYNLSACQDLTVENGSYVLVSNVSSNGTCFNIMANNITLDGDGYTVEYAKTTLGYGVNNSGGYDNVTIKNLDILQGGSGISYAHAVYFENVTIGNIINNSFITRSNFAHGVYINYSFQMNILNNTIYVYAASSSGIKELNSNNSLFFNNTINCEFMGSGDSAGIGLWSSNSSRLLNNTIFMNSSLNYGVFFSKMFNVTMIGNNISSKISVYIVPIVNLWEYNHIIDVTNTNNERPIYYYFNQSNQIIEEYNPGQIYLANSTNMTIKNTTIINKSVSLFIGYSNNISLIDSNLSNSAMSVLNSNHTKIMNTVFTFFDDNFGTVHFDNSFFNNISNNTITTYGISNYGLYLTNSDSNNITDNNLLSFGTFSHGIYLHDSDLNKFENNILNTSGFDSDGIYFLVSTLNNLSSNSIITFGDYGDGIFSSESDLNNYTNNTINTTGNSSDGIFFYYSNSNNITNNTIITSGLFSRGLEFDSSDTNTISNNTITTSDGGGDGIYADASTNMLLTGNDINTLNAYAIYFGTSMPISYYDHIIDITNTENGKLIYYYFNETDIEIKDRSDIGQLIVANSTNVTIKNITIDNSDGIILIHTKNSSIVDSNITTGTQNGVSTIHLYSSNHITIFNNTLISGGISSYGIDLESSDTNTIENNKITTFNVDGHGLYVQFSELNIILNNYVRISDGYGVYLSSSTENNIFGGSIWSVQSLDYYLVNAGITNTFQNTNFTTSRNIYFNDIISWFNYNNESSGNRWINTSISKQGNLSREIINWNNSLVKWNDTNGTSGITATYNLSGLTASSNYTIYNRTTSNIDTRSLITNSAGKLPSFSIFLDGETQITVEKYVAPTTPDTGSGEPPVIDPPASGDGNYTGNDLNETDDGSDDVLDPVVVNKSAPKVAEDTSLKDKAQDKLDELNELLGDIDDEAILVKINDAEEALALGQYSKAYALALQAEDMIAELRDGADDGKSSTFMIVMLFVILIGFAVVVAYFVYKKDSGIGIGDLDNPSDTDFDGNTVPLDSTIGGVSVPIGNESASVDDSFNSYDNSQTQNIDTLQSNQSDTNQFSVLSGGESNLEGVTSPDNPVDVVDNKRVNSNQTDEVEEELEDEFQDSIKKLRHETKD